MSEDALTSLRRSTRTTLLFTDLAVGVLPFGFIIRTGLIEPVLLGVLAVGAAAFVYLHMSRMLGVLQGSWRAFPLVHIYGMAAFALGLTALAVAIDKSAGLIGSFYTALAASEFIVARPRPWLHVFTVVVAHGTGLAGLIVLTGHSEYLTGVAVSLPLILFTTYALGVAYRQWEGALKLEEARRVAADLAATRERLRLAEDLHDVLGHALEVVSLKSELAVRLTDPDRSKAEMVEVQRLARNALRDVRALAHGNRSTDLATELAGAGKLLDSAGIRTDFHVDPTALTEPERELFGRILREAMTNALRHADPTTCSVTLGVQPDRVVFTVVNDGVVPVITESGSGLKSLERRVTATGGEFHAHPDKPASFEVRASLPR